MIRLDLPGGAKTLPRADVGRLRDAAAAQAGRSSAARDLPLILDRALAQERTIALRRGELRALIQIAAAAEMHELAADLEGTTPPARDTYKAAVSAHRAARAVSKLAGLR